MELPNSINFADKINLCEKMPKKQRFKLSIFTLISGLGWLLDITILLALVHSGMEPFTANIISAFCAVTFVFVFAQRRVFTSKNNGDVDWNLFAPYLIWQSIAVPTASWMLAILSSALNGPMTSADLNIYQLLGPGVLAAALAKIIITPITLYANFLFSGWLLERKISWF